MAKAHFLPRLCIQRWTWTYMDPIYRKKIQLWVELLKFTEIQPFRNECQNPKPRQIAGEEGHFVSQSQIQSHYKFEGWRDNFDCEKNHLNSLLWSSKCHIIAIPLQKYSCVSKKLASLWRALREDQRYTHSPLRTKSAKADENVTVLLAIRPDSNQNHCS